MVTTGQSPTVWRGFHCGRLREVHNYSLVHNQLFDAVVIREEENRSMLPVYRAVLVLIGFMRGFHDIKMSVSYDGKNVHWLKFVV